MQTETWIYGSHRTLAIRPLSGPRKMSKMADAIVSEAAFRSSPGLATAGPPTLLPARRGLRTCPCPTWATRWTCGERTSSTPRTATTRYTPSCRCLCLPTGGILGTALIRADRGTAAPPKLPATRGTHGHYVATRTTTLAWATSRTRSRKPGAERSIELGEQSVGGHKWHRPLADTSCASVGLSHRLVHRELDDYYHEVV